jgi:hypothetical protein
MFFVFLENGRNGGGVLIDLLKESESSSSALFIQCIKTLLKFDLGVRDWKILI